MGLGLEIQWIVVVIVVVAGATILSLWGRPKQKTVVWPAGPRKLPIIGNLHHLNSEGELLHITLSKMAQKYGPMFTVWFGGWRPTIVVNDHELAWEVLVTKSSEYSARMLPYMARFITADYNTISTSHSGPYWDSLRKGLQNTALNPQHISAQVGFEQSDISAMIDALESEASSNGRIVRPLVKLRKSTVRLIARLCFGVDFSDDMFVDGMDGTIEEAIGLAGHARLVDVYPASRYIPGVAAPFKQTYQVQRKIEKLVRPFLSSPKPNTYAQFLLSQNLPENVVIYTIFEVFLLAVDSTSNTVAWTLAFLVRDQEIQQKLYEEINSLIGSEKKGRVNVEDVSKMQYLHALMKESMRMKPIAPLAIPHMTAKNCKLVGTDIPVGTTVMVNLYSVLRDPRVWQDPDRFRPERFLPSYAQQLSSQDKYGDASARLRGMERSFLPFGGGRRVCAGAEVAKHHVALTLANLVSAYHWGPLDGQLRDMSEELTFVLMMKTPLVARICQRGI